MSGLTAGGNDYACPNNRELLTVKTETESGTRIRVPAA